MSQVFRAGKDFALIFALDNLVLLNMDKYEFCGLIGEGTYGSVYKVKNKLTNQRYACKVLRLQDEDEGSMFERFKTF